MQASATHCGSLKKAKNVSIAERKVFMFILTCFYGHQLTKIFETSTNRLHFPFLPTNGYLEFYLQGTESQYSNWFSYLLLNKVVVV